jgi:hypothetical protein
MARSSRRRLTWQWQAEAFECRCLLTNVLGGNVFEQVDMAVLSQFDAAGTTVIGNHVVVHGSNPSGDGEVAILNVTDAIFSEPETVLFPSEWKKSHPNDSSYANVKGAYMGPNGIVYALETATTEDPFFYQAVLADINGTTVIDLNQGVQVRVVGVADSGKLVLQSNGIGFIYDNGTTTITDGGGLYIPSAASMSRTANLIGGSIVDRDSNGVAQLWNPVGNRLATKLEDVNYDSILSLVEVEDGFLGTANFIDGDGNYKDQVITLTAIDGGYRVDSISTSYAPLSIRGVQEFGNAVYYVTDGPAANDAVIHVADSDDTISVANFLGDQTGVEDVVVNSFTLDPTGQFVYIQGYSETASGNESWIVSVSVSPDSDVPAKPTPNFQSLPIRTATESLVTWDAVDGAASYVVQINNLSTDTVERNVNVTPHELAVTIAEAGSYTIRVQAMGATGQLSPWSDATTFEIVTRAPLISVSGTGTQRTISWKVTESAPEYDVWVTSAATRTRVVDVQTSAQSIDVNLIPGTYWIWVRPLGTPTAQPWSSPRVLTMNDAVALTATSTVIQTSSLTWTGAADGVYDVWVSSRGTTSPVRRETVSGTTHQLTDLPDGDYTVWVRQLHPSNQAPITKWSTAVYFTVAGKPNVIASGTVLNWTTFADVNVQYELWVRQGDTGRVSVWTNFVSTATADLSTYGLTSGTYRIWIRAVTESSVFSRWSSAIDVVV